MRLSLSIFLRSQIVGFGVSEEYNEMVVTVSNFIEKKQKNQFSNETIPFKKRLYMYVCICVRCKNQGAGPGRSGAQCVHQVRAPHSKSGQKNRIRNRKAGRKKIHRVSCRTGQLM